MLGEVLIFLAVILLLSIWLHRKPKNLPPGEWGLPIVGYVPFVSWKMSDTLEMLQKKYGDIFTLKMGAKIMVVLSDYALIKKVFQRSEFSGRPFFYHYEVLKKHIDKGTILSNGQVWTTNRRFALKTLRDFGFGKVSFLDEIINSEANSLVQDLKRYENKPIEIEWNVNVAVLNVIWKLVANQRYNITDKEIVKFSKDFNDNLVDVEGPLAMLTLFPWSIPFVPNFVKNKWLKEAVVKRKRDQTIDLFKEIIRNHKERLDPQNPKDFIDKYLIELEEQKNNQDYQHWGDDDLILNVYDFFLAGSETTSSTLRWFFLYMVKFPDVQKRVQRNIDETVPKGQHVSLHHKDRLPYLEALSYEINRIVSLLPNGVPHEVTEDSEIEGYNIPKGTWVVPFIESCHRNPKYWKYPNTLSLENFLDDEGNILRNKEGYLPFSLGRRFCLGESLAKMELFVFMGTILQNFEISEPANQNVPLKPISNVNILNYAENFKVILKGRN